MVKSGTDVHGATGLFKETASGDRLSAERDQQQPLVHIFSVSLLKAKIYFLKDGAF